MSDAVLRFCLSVAKSQLWDSETPKTVVAERLRENMAGLEQSPARLRHGTGACGHFEGIRADRSTVAANIRDP